MIYIKTKKEIDYIRESCRIVAEALQLMKANAKPGITTLELDKIAEEESRSVTRENRRVLKDQAKENSAEARLNARESKKIEKDDMVRLVPQEWKVNEDLQVRLEKIVQ